mmetsp:Transcript_14863/g.47426  ORF Transcript_14863/g.47426 Transcript_14863/m.47426 type:complete len:286 (+) Transcript_14863:1667-2524(+)
MEDNAALERRDEADKGGQQEESLHARLVPLPQPQEPQPALGHREAQEQHRDCEEPKGAPDMHPVGDDRPVRADVVGPRHHHQRDELAHRLGVALDEVTLHQPPARHRAELLERRGLRERKQKVVHARHHRHVEGRRPCAHGRNHAPRDDCRARDGAGTKQHPLACHNHPRVLQLQPPELERRPDPHEEHRDSAGPEDEEGEKNRLPFRVRDPREHQAEVRRNERGPYGCHRTLAHPEGVQHVRHHRPHQQRPEDDRAPVVEDNHESRDESRSDPPIVLELVRLEP